MPAYRRISKPLLLFLAFRGSYKSLLTVVCECQDYRTPLWDWALLLLASKAQLTDARPPLQQPLHDGHLDHDDVSSQYGSHGAVACESAICSKIGVDLMRQGVCLR